MKKRDYILLALTVFIGIWVLGNMSMLIFPNIINRLAMYSSRFDMEKEKAYAEALFDKGFYHEAAIQYEMLISVRRVKYKESAKLSYVLGNIYMEHLKDYESALRSYLMAESYASSDSPFLDETKKKKKECLRRLGKISNEIPKEGKDKENKNNKDQTPKKPSFDEEPDNSWNHANLEVKRLLPEVFSDLPKI